MKYILDLLFPDVEAGNYTALVVIVCVAFTLWLLTAVARWRTFNKMGEAGWKAFVPFYSLYILYSKCWSTKAARNCASWELSFPRSLNSEHSKRMAKLRRFYVQ